MRAEFVRSPLAETPSTPERIEPIAGVPLIFELSSEGRRGTDLSPRAAGDRRGAELLGAELCREDLPGFPELSEPQVLRHFLRLSQLNFAQALAVLSARLVHDEVQPGRQRRAGRAAGARWTASGDARASGAGRARTDRADGSGAGRNHRHGRRVAASRGRRARRADGTADGPRVSSQARRSAPQGDHSRHCARHQSGQLHARGLRGDRREIESARLSRSGRGSPAGERRRRRDDGHQSEHARNFRAARSRRSRLRCTSAARCSTSTART